MSVIFKKGRVFEHTQGNRFFQNMIVYRYFIYDGFTFEDFLILPVRGRRCLLLFVCCLMSLLGYTSVCVWMQVALLWVVYNE